MKFHKIMDKEDKSEEFAREAEKKGSSILGEFWYFIRKNKKWWLTPIIIIMLLFGVLIILGGTGAAPFIYTLF